MSYRCWSSLATISLVVAALAVPAMSASGAPPGPAVAKPGAAPSRTPSKVPSMVRAEMDALARSGGVPAKRSAASRDLLDINRGRGLDLLVHGLGAVSAAQTSQLTAMGATVLSSTAGLKAVPGVAVPQAGVIRAVIPYDRVDAVAALSWVAAIRPTMRGAMDIGSVTSQGVTLHRTTQSNTAGFTGTGQTVGVISDGVTNLASAQASGNLGAVNVLDAGAGDEGTAMLEIIADEAPGATLLFNTVGDSLLSYVAAFHNLANAGAKLIAEDIAFDDEPAFQQGLGATTADLLARSGVWVSSSAGNLGAKHAARGPAVGAGRTPDDATGSFAGCPAGAPHNLVNLRGTDNTYDVQIANGGAILPTLQWSEPRAIYPTAGQGGFTDLNVYLMNADGTDCLGSSTNVQANGVGDTIEQFGWGNTTGATVRAKLVVDVAGTSSAVTPPILDLRWRTAGVTTLDPAVRAGSLNPDSNYLGQATSAAAVGANVSTDPSVVPLETYSAAGPVQVGVTTRCRAGVPGPCRGVPGPVFKTAGAPTWAGADGVSVSGAGGFPSTFFGTSAAAPSVAGVAALLRQELGGRLRPAQLNLALRLSAVPRTDSGIGAGVVRSFP